jgi:hypothetical protein
MGAHVPAPLLLPDDAPLLLDEPPLLLETTPLLLPLLLPPLEPPDLPVPPSPMPPVVWPPQAAARARMPAKRRRGERMGAGPKRSTRPRTAPLNSVSPEERTAAAYWPGWGGSEHGDSVAHTQPVLAQRQFVAQTSL